MKNQVVVVGNPFDGMTVYGPFELTDELFRDIAPRLGAGNDWWIVNLEDDNA